MRRPLDVALILAATADLAPRQPEPLEVRLEPPAPRDEPTAAVEVRRATTTAALAPSPPTRQQQRKARRDAAKRARP